MRTVTCWAPPCLDSIRTSSLAGSKVIAGRLHSSQVNTDLSSTSSSRSGKTATEWFYGEQDEPATTQGHAESDDIDITDPELSLFFRGEWDELTEEEKEFIKGMIRESRELLRKRREGGRQ